MFAPREADMYPVAQTYHVDPAANTSPHLEGEFRAGHFRGVATVVMKLLNVVQPNVALFGKKDYQQLMVPATWCPVCNAHRDSSARPFEQPTVWRCHLAMDTSARTNERKHRNYKGPTSRGSAHAGARPLAELERRSHGRSSRTQLGTGLHLRAPARDLQPPPRLMTRSSFWLPRNWEERASSTISRSSLRVFDTGNATPARRAHRGPTTSPPVRSCQFPD